LTCDFVVHLGFPVAIFLAGLFLVAGDRFNFHHLRRSLATRRGPALLQCVAKSCSCECFGMALVIKQISFHQRSVLLNWCVFSFVVNVTRAESHMQGTATIAG